MALQMILEDLRAQDLATPQEKRWGLLLGAGTWPEVRCASITAVLPLWSMLPMCNVAKCAIAGWHTVKFGAAFALNKST